MGFAGALLNTFGLNIIRHPWMGIAILLMANVTFATVLALLR